MARIVLTDAFISVNAVDLSARCTELAIDEGFDVIEEGAMGFLADNGRAGLNNHAIMAKFRQDYADGSVDAVLFPLNGTATASVIVRGKVSAASTTNGQWTLNPAYVDYPNPGSGSPGGGQEVDVNFLSAGTAFVYAEA